jgi:D-glycero-D-manno-heptose 1,7-bisphosphate phosphatase
LNRRYEKRGQYCQRLADTAQLCDALIEPSMQTPLAEIVQYVFLDRDGVLNKKMPEGRFVTTPQELVLCPGAAWATSRLNQIGVKVILITNQRGVALGLYSEDELLAIHQRLGQLLAAEGAHLDGIYYCPHQRESCECRKPKPGMILRAFGEFAGADVNNSLMIGDSLSDIQTGHSIGMQTVFIEGDAVTQQAGPEIARALATYISPSLEEFVRGHFT